MSWHLATLGQLYLIAFGDEPCTPLDRKMAIDEINRRKKQRHSIKQYREKRKYAGA